MRIQQKLSFVWWRLGLWTVLFLGSATMTAAFHVADVPDSTAVANAINNPTAEVWQRVVGQWHCRKPGGCGFKKNFWGRPKRQQCNAKWK